MITDSSLRSVAADIRVIVRLRAEDTVPGSPVAPGLVPGPEGGVVPGGRHDAAGGRPAQAAGADSRRFRVPAGVVIRAGADAGLRPRRRACGVISPARRCGQRGDLPGPGESW